MNLGRGVYLTLSIPTGVRCWLPSCLSDQSNSGNRCTGNNGDSISFLFQPSLAKSDSYGEGPRGRGVHEPRHNRCSCSDICCPCNSCCCCSAHIVCSSRSCCKTHTPYSSHCCYNTCIAYRTCSSSIWGMPVSRGTHLQARWNSSLVAVFAIPAVGVS